MTSEDIVLSCRDCEGRIVIFHKKNYDKHKRYHRELEDRTFHPDKIKNALKNPTFTIPGNGTATTCYYVEEFTINGIIKLTKVVVRDIPDKMDGKNVHHIMTAFKTDHVQELNYSHLKKQDYYKGKKI